MHRGHAINKRVFRDGERYAIESIYIPCCMHWSFFTARLTAFAWRCQFDEEVIRALEEGELYGDACGEAKALKCTGNSVVVAQDVQAIPYAPMQRRSDRRKWVFLSSMLNIFETDCQRTGFVELGSASCKRRRWPGCRKGASTLTSAWLGRYDLPPGHG